ncbi:MAG: DUF494 family protein [bacterium]
MVSFILSRTFEGDDDENWGDARQRIGEILEDHGFHPAEITMALDVAYRIRQRLSDHEYYSVPVHTNRVYQYLEEIRLTREARGYLIRLLHENAMTHEQYQQVIEKSLMVDMPEVGIEEVQLIANDLLGNEDDPGTGQDISKLLH